MRGAGVSEIRIYGVPVSGEVAEGTDVGGLVVDAARRCGCGIRDGDVVVIASKIVSKAEGMVVRVGGVRAGTPAKILSRFLGMREGQVELYLRQGRVVAVIPLKLIEGYLRRYTRDLKAVEEAVAPEPYLLLIRTPQGLMSWGGIDLSNVPRGYAVLPPRDPDASARRIRDRIKELTGCDVAVILSDTEWTLSKFGSIDVAIGSAGIAPVRRGFGSRDIYGKPKFGGIDVLVDLIAAAAALLMGQAAESVPIAIVRGVRYEPSDEGVKDITYPSKLLRKGLVKVVLLTSLFKLVHALASILRFFKR